MLECIYFVFFFAKSSNFDYPNVQFYIISSLFVIALTTRVLIDFTILMVVVLGAIDNEYLAITKSNKTVIQARLRSPPVLFPPLDVNPPNLLTQAFLNSETLIPGLIL